MNNKLVNFGKYKNQPIEIMLEDTGYCNWVLSQEDMKVKYAWIFQAIQNAIQVEDTPEHNALQNRFLNKDYCIKLGNYFFELNKKEFEREEHTQYTNHTVSDNTLKEEIIEELAKELTMVILNQFNSLVPFFNVYGMEKQTGVELEEYTKYYFEKYNLEEHLTYFEKTKNVFGLSQDKEHEKKQKFIEKVINEVKKDIFSKLEPLISFRHIEEINDLTIYFSFDNKFLIKYCCNLQRARDYSFDFSYETGKLDVETIEINSYTDNPKETLPKIIEIIDNDNNTRNVGNPIFEKDNVDVIYTFYPSKRSFDKHLGISLKIELKPTISEDYPSILRKANKDGVNIVFCDNITANASIEDIKKIYKQHNIDLITSSDLDTILIENKQSTQIEKILEKIDTISIDGKCSTEEVKRLIIELTTN